MRAFVLLFAVLPFVVKGFSDTDFNSTKVIDDEAKRLGDDGCYALPIIYGGTCTSSRGLVGSTGTRVCYHAEPLGDTALKCEGLGLCQGKWGMCQLGLLTSGDACIPWGANAAKPQIKCAGQPLGSAFNWNWYN